MEILFLVELVFIFFQITISIGTAHSNRYFKLLKLIEISWIREIVPRPLKGSKLNLSTREAAFSGPSNPKAQIWSFCLAYPSTKLLGHKTKANFIFDVFTSLMKG